VQLDLPFLRSPDAPPDPPIDFVRMRRARKYILRVRPDGRVRVTIPRGGSRAEAARFVERHLGWLIEEQARVAAQHGPRAWSHGTLVRLRGAAVPLQVARHARGLVATYGDRRVPITGDPPDLRPQIEADLRALARELLVPRLRELAAHHGLEVTRVNIRGQRSRWGSCSRSGAIALNFRLVQMPPDVCDYVLIHELMHLKQQNHGPRFWRLVQAACPDYRAAERWLKTEGRALF
jgi:predicted metal-dependent hydrolase